MKRLVTLCVLLASVLFVGCHHEHEEVHEQGKYLATSPIRKDTSLTQDFVAQIRAIQHIEVRALEKGYLTGIFVDEGQRIEKGTKMFQIMPVIYNAEVQKANAEALLSSIELKNTQMLADKNVVSPNELALAQAKYSKAKAELQLASTHKQLTEIHAPFDGLMGRFQVRLGSLVDEGDLLTTFSDNSKVWVYFNVSEAEYLKYQSQPEDQKIKKVKLVMANGETFDQEGIIETIEADFNNATGNLAFRATFPNPKSLLRHGETGKVLMEVPLKQALIIPQKATFNVLDKKFVFVIDDKGVAHARAITIAAEMPQLFVVSSGLEEKEKILIDGLRKVRDGSHVEIEFQEPTEVLNHLEVPAE